jgi:hypothetical protein
LVVENKWQSLAIRANDISAFDLDDIDEHGALIVEDETEDDEDAEAKPAKASKPLRRKPGNLSKIVISRSKRPS